MSNEMVEAAATRSVCLPVCPIHPSVCLSVFLSVFWGISKVRLSGTDYMFLAHEGWPGSGALSQKWWLGRVAVCCRTLKSFELYLKLGARGTDYVFPSEMLVMMNVIVDFKNHHRYSEVEFLDTVQTEMKSFLMERVCLSLRPSLSLSLSVGLSISVCARVCEGVWVCVYLSFCLSVCVCPVKCNLSVCLSFEWGWISRHRPDWKKQILCGTGLYI